MWAGVRISLGVGSGAGVEEQSPLMEKAHGEKLKVVCGLLGSETLPGGLRDQSYFHNNTKMLFSFFTVLICALMV